MVVVMEPTIIPLYGHVAGKRRSFMRRKRVRIVSKFIPNEKEEVGLFLDGLVEPLFLDHNRNSLDCCVVIIVGKVV